MGFMEIAKVLEQPEFHSNFAQFLAFQDKLRLATQRIQSQFWHLGDDYFHFEAQHGGETHQTI